MKIFSLAGSAALVTGSSQGIGHAIGLGLHAAGASVVVRVHEEHGYLRGTAVDALQIGERILFTPAHVCTVVNLTDQVVVTAGEQVVDTWTVEARGRTC
jgi:D-serine deaminase-like pyridoxal phosphate-dependent protein